VLVQVARLKFWSLEESAGINFTFRADTAGGSSCAAHIESRQLIAEGVEVKE